MPPAGEPTVLSRPGTRGGRLRATPTEPEVIRILTQIALSLTLAVLALVAFGSVLLSWQGPAPPQTVAARPVPLPENPVPAVGPRPQAPARAVEASTIRPERAVGECEVRITGSNPGGQPLLLALHAPRSGLRLASREVGTLPATLRFTDVPAGKVHVHLGRCLACTRLNYIVRTEVEITAGGIAKTSVSSDTRSLRVKLALARPPTAAEHRPSIARIPVMLWRVDDPAWRYRKPFSPDAEALIVRTDESGLAEFADLGPGTYRLEFHGFDAEPAERKRLIFELGEFDEGRAIPGLAH